MTVWCVWTESGEYESYSRDLRGIFLTREVAAAHAAQLEDGAEVEESCALAELPRSVPYIAWSAHIEPSGAESPSLGWSRGEKYRSWSNETQPLESSRLSKWSGTKPDLYIEVVGSDEALVEAEYLRLLAEARARLGVLSG